MRRRQPIMGGLMGRIVYAAAMSHVLYPDYYGENVGPHGRKMVEELVEVVRDMGRTLAAAAPDALVVVADDHLNVFSFDAVPALCVRVGRSVSRMVQADAIEFDRALDGLPERYPLHEDLANGILEKGVQAGFDFAASWSAPRAPGSGSSARWDASTSPRSSGTWHEPLRDERRALSAEEGAGLPRSLPGESRRGPRRRRPVGRGAGRVRVLGHAQAQRAR